jgi:hypothetical protein
MSARSLSCFVDHPIARTVMKIVVGKSVRELTAADLSRMRR